MKRIKKKDIETNININITDADTYVIVYNEKDWEGGRISEMPLKTKAEFYHVASQLSNVLFDIFDFYREEDICIGPFFELSIIVGGRTSTLSIWFRSLKCKLNQKIIIGQIPRKIRS